MNQFVVLFQPTQFGVSSTRLCSYDVMGEVMLAGLGEVENDETKDRLTDRMLVVG